MSTEKARGIVIREVAVGESDKIITLLTKDKGKITLSARGARKTGSKYLASCELFSYSDFVIYTASKNPSVASAVLIDNFYGIRKKLEIFTAGSYLSEFCGKMIFEGENCGDVTLLLLTALKVMEKGIREPLFVVLVFELKFLSLSGMLPMFESCINCGKSLSEGGYIISDGGLCRDCKGEKEMRELSSGTIKALSYIASSDIKKTFDFGISPKTKTELKYIRDLLFAYHVDTPFRTYDFFVQMNSPL